MRDRIYVAWYNMLDRCYDPQCPAYKHYGGRGIQVCDEWRTSYPKFKAWAIENGYSDDLTIDRINNDCGYTPTNCRWVTKTENCRRGRTRRLEANGRHRLNLAISLGANARAEMLVDARQKDDRRYCFTRLVEDLIDREYARLFPE